VVAAICLLFVKYFGEEAMFAELKGKIGEINRVREINIEFT